MGAAQLCDFFGDYLGGHILEGSRLHAAVVFH